MRLRFQPTRLKAFAVLCLLFCLGLYFLTDMFAREIPRLGYFHRIAIWIGEGMAILTAFFWTMLPEETPNKLDYEFPQFAPFWTKRRMKFLLALSLLTGLILDLSITGHGFYDEYKAHQRSIPVVATVTNVKKIGWMENDAAFFEMDVEFKDENGKTHTSKIEYINQQNEGPPAWVPRNLHLALKNDKVLPPFNIKYDPMRPKRVWAKLQSWNRENAIHYIFILVHFFQGIITLSIVVGLFVDSQADQAKLSSNMQVIPFATEVIVLIFFGFLFWLRGF